MISLNSINCKLDKLKQELTNEGRPTDILVFVDKQGASISLYKNNKTIKHIFCTDYDEYDNILNKQYADVEKIIFLQNVEQ